MKHNNEKLTVELLIIFGLMRSSDICIFLFSGSNKTSATPIAYAINASEIFSISDFGQIFSMIFMIRSLPFGSFLKIWEKIFFSLDWFFHSFISSNVAFTLIGWRSYSLYISDFMREHNVPLTLRCCFKSYKKKLSLFIGFKILINNNTNLTKTYISVIMLFVCYGPCFLVKLREVRLVLIEQIFFGYILHFFLGRIHRFV